MNDLKEELSVGHLKIQGLLEQITVLKTTVRERVVVMSSPPPG